MKPKCKVQCVQMTASQTIGTMRVLSTEIPFNLFGEHLEAKAAEFQAQILSPGEHEYEDKSLLHVIIYNRQGKVVDIQLIPVYRSIPGDIAKQIVAGYKNGRFKYWTKCETVREALFYAVERTGDDPDEVVVVCDDPEILDKPINTIGGYIDFVAYSPTRIYVVDWEHGWDRACPEFDAENLFTWFPRNPEESTVPLVAHNET